MHETLSGPRFLQTFSSIGWGEAPMLTHAHVMRMLRWMVRADVQCMPYNKVGVRLWFGFYVFMNESGRHPVSVGYRISQPLWQIENHSASLCCVTHLGSWQENAQIKEFPFVRRLQIAAVVFFLCGWQIAARVNGAGLLLIHKRSRRSHRRFIETFRTMCGLNTFAKRHLKLC